MREGPLSTFPRAIDLNRVSALSSKVTDFALLRLCVNLCWKSQYLVLRLVAWQRTADSNGKDRCSREYSCTRHRLSSVAAKTGGQVVRRVRCRAAPNAVMQLSRTRYFPFEPFAFFATRREATGLLDSGPRTHISRIDYGDFRTPRILNPRKCLCKYVLASHCVWCPSVNCSFPVIEGLNVRLAVTRLYSSQRIATNNDCLDSFAKERKEFSLFLNLAISSVSSAPSAG